MAHDEQFEVQRPERAAVVGHARQHRWQLAGVLVDGAGIDERMPEHALVVGQGELDRRDRVMLVRSRRDMPRVLVF